MGEPPAQAAAPQPAAPEDAISNRTLPAGGDAMSPASVLASMHVEGQQKEQLLRIVAAGKKVMYSQQTHQMMLESMQGEGAPEEKLSKGIIGLLSMLWGESKGSLPPQLIIPAGMVLMADAADFMRQAGEPVTPEQFGAATEMMVDGLLKQGGVDPDKLAAQAGGGEPEEEENDEKMGQPGAMA